MESDYWRVQNWECRAADDGCDRCIWRVKYFYCASPDRLNRSDRDTNACAGPDRLDGVGAGHRYDKLASGHPEFNRYHCYNRGHPGNRARAENDGVGAGHRHDSAVVRVDRLDGFDHG